MSASMVRRLRDQVEMPDYNPAANLGRGRWGLRNISDGTVFAHPVDVVRCVDHGAMNSVSPTGTLWRCLTCGRAAYHDPKPKKEAVAGVPHAER